MFWSVIAQYCQAYFYRLHVYVAKKGTVNFEDLIIETILYIGIVEYCVLDAEKKWHERSYTLVE